MNLGWGELLVILVILLLLFGAKRLPEIGRSLGQALRELQKSTQGKDEQEPEKSKEGSP